VRSARPHDAIVWVMNIFFLLVVIPPVLTLPSTGSTTIK
jgi:hypothetical protein